MILHADIEWTNNSKFNRFLVKKEETISLSLALGSIVSITIALLLDYGGWRKALVILAVILLILSMGPFKAEGQRRNRVEKFVIILFFSAFAGVNAFTLLYLGIKNFHQEGWIYLVLFSLVSTAVGYYAYFSIRGEGWLNTSTNWMGIVAPPSVRAGKGKNKGV